MGGVYEGDSVPCGEAPCSATPNDLMTWGKIKSIYVQPNVGP
jgi:hypothetical protein